MNYGIPASDLNAIEQIFTGYADVSKVMLFGSRAMGTFRPGSDVDLAVFGETLTVNDILRLSIRLDELESLFRFDLINYQSINNPALREHIQRRHSALRPANNSSTFNRLIRFRRY